MKDFIILFIAIVCLTFAFQKSNIFSTTRYGKRQESFKSLNASILPPVLAGYLAERHAKYELYLIPNYMRDFLSLNEDFKSVYNEKPKYSIILFAPTNDNASEYNSFKLFYNTLKKELNNYSQSFNVLYFYENNNTIYENSYDNIAYKDLLEYCNHFCVIDPSRNTLLSFKRLGTSEMDSLSALLQQYSFMLK